MTNEQLVDDLIKKVQARNSAKDGFLGRFIATDDSELTVAKRLVLERMRPDCEVIGGVDGETIHITPIEPDTCSGNHLEITPPPNFLGPIPDEPKCA